MFCEFPDLIKVTKELQGKDPPFVAAVAAAATSAEPLPLLGFFFWASPSGLQFPHSNPKHHL